MRRRCPRLTAAPGDDRGMDYKTGGSRGSGLRAVGLPEMMPRVGMRVRMAAGYQEQGTGTVVNVPGTGVCSVSWDSGVTEVRGGTCSGPVVRRRMLCARVRAHRGRPAVRSTRLTVGRGPLADSQSLALAASVPVRRGGASMLSRTGSLVADSPLRPLAGVHLHREAWTVSTGPRCACVRVLVIGNTQ